MEYYLSFLNREPAIPPLHAPLKTETMSEGIVRKIQPFTIGTKLSVPGGPKCPDFEDTFLPSQNLDTCELQNSLSDQVALYLGQSQIQAPSPQLSPTGDPLTAGKAQADDPAKEDSLNRNGVSPTSSSRSIRKITISGGPDSPGDAPTLGDECPVSMVTSRPESITINNNNNNNSNANNNNNSILSADPVPRIVGVSCENTPNSHLKVTLNIFLLFVRCFDLYNISALLLPRTQLYQYPLTHYS